MFDINDDSAVPPLPKEILLLGATDQPLPCRGTPFLKPGCWIVQFVPTFADDVDPKLAEFPILRSWTLRYLGTMRVDCPSLRRPAEMRRQGCGVVVSGDLYIDRQPWSVKKPATPPALPQPAEIPVYAAKDYAFYFTLQQAALEPGRMMIQIASYRFDSAKLTWGPQETLTVRMETERAPLAWQSPEPKNFLWGTVYNERGSQVGVLQMGWLSPSLRKAQLEIAVAAGLQPPLENGKGDTIQQVFQRIGWDLGLRPTLSAQGPKVWLEKDLHAKMLELRSAVDLDREWVYHVLVVPRFNDSEEFGFGKMYDVGALDTDLMPREGLVVAAEARFPREERFGNAAGERLMDVPAAAFHNLVHELGHAMGLLHRFRGADFMQALIHIASRSSTAAPFPDNLSFRFDPQDELRLQHYPDLWVRPGGVPFGQGASALPIPDVDAITDAGEDFDLYVEPLSPVVPLGAPVKLQLRLTNKSAQSLPGPKILSLSDGSVHGRVIGPANEPRSFSAAAPLDFMLTAALPAGQSLYRGETLWRGPDGALFPSPGVYAIEVKVEWVGPGGIASVSAVSNVLVAEPRSRRHARAALDLLSSEDLAILLVFRTSPTAGADKNSQRLQKAIETVQQALQVKALRPSLSTIEALRLACIDLPQAACLVSEKSQMNTAEIEKLLNLVKQAAPEVQRQPAVARMVEICRDKAAWAVSQGLASESLSALADQVYHPDQNDDSGRTRSAKGGQWLEVSRKAQHDGRHPPHLPS